MHPGQTSKQAQHITLVGLGLGVVPQLCYQTPQQLQSNKKALLPKQKEDGAQGSAEGHGKTLGIRTFPEGKNKKRMYPVVLQSKIGTTPFQWTQKHNCSVEQWAYKDCHTLVEYYWTTVNNHQLVIGWLSMVGSWRLSIGPSGIGS